MTTSDGKPPQKTLQNIPLDTSKPVLVIAQFKQDRSFIDRSRDIVLTLDKKSGEEFLQKFDHYDSLFCVFFKMTHPEDFEKDIDVVLNLSEQTSRDFIRSFGQGDLLAGVIFKSPYENEACDIHDTPKVDTNGVVLNDKQVTSAARWAGERRTGNKREGHPVQGAEPGTSRLRNILIGERVIPLDEDNESGL